MNGLLPDLCLAKRPADEGIQPVDSVVLEKECI